MPALDKFTLVSSKNLLHITMIYQIIFIYFVCFAHQFIFPYYFRSHRTRSQYQFQICANLCFQYIAMSFIITFLRSIEWPI